MSFKVVINMVGFTTSQVIEFNVTRLPSVGDFVNYGYVYGENKEGAVTGKVLNREFSIEVDDNEEKVYLLIDEKQYRFVCDDDHKIINED